MCGECVSCDYGGVSVLPSARSLHRDLLPFSGDAEMFEVTEEARGFSWHRHGCPGSVYVSLPGFHTLVWPLLCNCANNNDLIAPVSGTPGILNEAPQYKVCARCIPLLLTEMWPMKPIAFIFLLEW